MNPIGNFSRMRTVVFVFILACSLITPQPGRVSSGCDPFYSRCD